MKTLLLVRHAKSGWGDADQRDFDRTLNDRGRKTADGLGVYLHASDPMPDAILCSPAVRTKETWKLIDLQTGWSVVPHLIKDIYMASAEQLLQIIHALHEPYQRVMLIGHNPGLEDLILLLTGQGDQKLRKVMEEKLPTATLAQLDFDVPLWADIKPKLGTLKRFIRPRDLGFSPEDEG
jgi:phosphohistidine phosphatase